MADRQAREAWNAAEATLRCSRRMVEAAAIAASGEAAIAQAARSRLEALLELARRASRFHRERIPAARKTGTRIRDIAPLTKAEVMANFDALATDPEVTLSRARAFISKPALVGAPFLGRHAIWTSSGTSGTPGVFVHGADALAVYDALALSRYAGPAGTWGWSESMGFAARGQRNAFIAATGGHFAGVATLERLRSTYSWIRESARVFSVATPLPELCEALDRFDPAMITSYPTVLRLLARERAEGRLHVNPVKLWSGGEACSRAARRDIEHGFGCRLLDDYGSSEFLNIAFQCPQGALHVNADWVLLEPVDELMRPVPPGVASFTVLLTNLANTVQPLIRYNLGDRVTLTGRACHCGSSFPVMRVEGRCDEVLEMARSGGGIAPLPPLALCTVIEEGAGVHRFQVVQTGASRLEVRIEVPEGQASGAVVARVRSALDAYLSAQGARKVTLDVVTGPVASNPGSGKLRQVMRSPALSSPPASRSRPRSSR